MEQENEQALEGVEEQEENTQDEESNEEEQSESDDDSVTLSKAEFKKLRRQAIAYEANKNKPEVKQERSETSSDITSERFERLELKADGYSQEEIDEIMDLGGQKVLKTNLVQAAIKAMRAEKKSKDASQPLSSKSPIFKKFTQEDLSKMSSTELEKILPKD